MRAQELETDEGILEMRVQKMSKENIIFFIKLIIVDTDSLFELYLANICSVCTLFQNMQDDVPIEVPR